MIKLEKIDMEREKDLMYRMDMLNKITRNYGLNARLCSMGNLLEFATSTIGMDLHVQHNKNGFVDVTIDGNYAGEYGSIWEATIGALWCRFTEWDDREQAWLAVPMNYPHNVGVTITSSNLTFVYFFPARDIMMVMGVLLDGQFIQSTIRKDSFRYHLEDFERAEFGLDLGDMNGTLETHDLLVWDGASLWLNDPDREGYSMYIHKGKSCS